MVWHDKRPLRSDLPHAATLCRGNHTIPRRSGQPAQPAFRMRLSVIARSVASIWAILLFVSCSQAPENSPLNKSLIVARSAQDFDSIRTGLAANAAGVKTGDTIVFAVTVTNLSDSRIQIVEQCGRGVDVVITGASESRSASADLLGPNGFVPCVLRDEHFLKAKEQRTVTIPWKATLGAGEYTAQSGVWKSDGLANVSAPLRFKVN